MTKAQLAAQNAALIAELSALRTTLEALKAPKLSSVKCPAHDYADYAEARNNAKRLAMSDLGQRYIFTQVGTRVIAKMRA